METCPAGELSTPSEFMGRARKMEEACESATDAALSKAGTKAPKCVANFAALVVHMDAVSSCYWCCLGGDHRLEYLAGRLVGSARASMGLLRRGFYDESLNLTRSLGEIANLLFLFAQDRSAYERWVALDETLRRREFSPVRVRLAIEAKGLPIPIDEQRYSSLSEVATHVSPLTRPNAHSPDQRPSSGGYFNLASSMAALNELAGAFAVASFAIGQLIDLPKEHKMKVALSAHALLVVVGGVSLATVRKN
jgi:hypothetical protein